MRLLRKRRLTLVLLLFFFFFFFFFFAVAFLFLILCSPVSLSRFWFESVLADAKAERRRKRKEWRRAADGGKLIRWIFDLIDELAAVRNKSVAQQREFLVRFKLQRSHYSNVERIRFFRYEAAYFWSLVNKYKKKCKF